MEREPVNFGMRSTSSYRVDASQENLEMAGFDRMASTQPDFSDEPRSMQITPPSNDHHSHHSQHRHHGYRHQQEQGQQRYHHEQRSGARHQESTPGSKLPSSSGDLDGVPKKLSSKDFGNAARHAREQLSKKGLMTSGSFFLSEDGSEYGGSRSGGSGVLGSYDDRGSAASTRRRAERSASSQSRGGSKGVATAAAAAAPVSVRRTSYSSSSSFDESARGRSFSNEEDQYSINKRRYLKADEIQVTWLGGPSIASNPFHDHACPQGTHCTRDSSCPYRRTCDHETPCEYGQECTTLWRCPHGPFCPHLEPSHCALRYLCPHGPYCYDPYSCPLRADCPHGWDCAAGDQCRNRYRCPHGPQCAAQKEGEVCELLYPCHHGMRCRNPDDCPERDLCPHGDACPVEPFRCAYLYRCTHGEAHAKNGLWKRCPYRFECRHLGRCPYGNAKCPLSFTHPANNYKGRWRRKNTLEVQKEMLEDFRPYSCCNAAKHIFLCGPQALKKSEVSTKIPQYKYLAEQRYPPRPVKFRVGARKAEPPSSAVPAPAPRPVVVVEETAFEEKWRSVGLDRDSREPAGRCVQAARAAGYAPSVDDIERFASAHPYGATAPETSKWAAANWSHTDSAEDLVAAFRKFDRAGDGRISAAIVRNLLQNLGEPMTAAEYESFARQMGIDNSRDIDYVDLARRILDC